MKPLFCEVTSWWDWYYIRNQISPHFFYYPVQLMIERGFNAEVLTLSNPEGRETKYESHPNLEIYRFVADHNVSLCARLFTYMVKKQYSLIHLHEVKWPVDCVTWIISRVKNTPMVFTTHAWQLDSLLKLESKIPLIGNVRAHIFIKDSPTCVFVAFTRTQAEAYKRMGINNIKIIPHGIDVAPFEIERDDKIEQKYGLEELNILCVGMMDPRKGQHFLVKSMPKILKEYPHTKLLLVGRTYDRGKYLGTLKSLAQKLELRDKVEFLSDVTRSELIQLYLWSSLFVLPTQAELFGLVFLEAMAAGLPVITTNRPHLREILGNGEAGVLVEREQKSIENAILNLLRDDDLRRRLGNNGKKLVLQKYRLEKVIQQLWNLYKALLDLNAN